MKPNSGTLKSSTCSWLAFVPTRYYHAIIRMLLKSLCGANLYTVYAPQSSNEWPFAHPSKCIMCPYWLTTGIFYRPCHCNLLRNKSFYKNKSKNRLSELQLNLRHEKIGNLKLNEKIGWSILKPQNCSHRRHDFGALHKCPNGISPIIKVHLKIVE